jgi:hypothetical protein
MALRWMCPTALPESPDAGAGGERRFRNRLILSARYPFIGICEILHCPRVFSAMELMAALPRRATGSDRRRLRTGCNRERPPQCSALRRWKLEAVCIDWLRWRTEHDSRIAPNHAVIDRHELCACEGMTKARRKTVEDAPTMTADRDRVAVRAYELYEARGCGEGQDLDDWLCAERELNSASNPNAQTYRDRDES